MKHLPECPDQHSTNDGTCICDRLRACEERVRHEKVGSCIRHYDAGVAAGIAAIEADIISGAWLPYHCVDCIEADEVEEAFAERRAV